MDDIFDKDEKLYRAVYPPSHPRMFWKKDGSLSSAAFHDKKGLSVERGNNRKSEEVVENMKKFFVGCIVSVKVDDCNAINALVKYCPSERSKYHSEIHGSKDDVLLSREQRYYLAQKAVKEYVVP